MAWGHRVTVIAGDYDGAAQGRPIRRAPDDPPDGHAAHRLPAGRLGDPAAASAATPTSCSRSSTASRFGTPLWPWLRKPRVAARPPRPPGPLRHRARPARARRGGRRSSGSRCAPLPRRARPDDLAGLARGARGARRRARPHPRRLPRPGPGRPGAGREVRAADAALPRAPEAVQAHRPRPRRRRRAARGHARHRRATATSARRSSRRSSTAGLADRVDLPRPRQRGGEGSSSTGPLVARADRLVGRGLVPERGGGGRVPHADRGAARRRPARRSSSTTRPACWPTSPRSSSRACATCSPTARAWRRYSDAALARAESFTWDTTASGMLEVMEQSEAVHNVGRTRLRSTFRASESGKAAGLAGRDAAEQRDPAHLHDRLHAPARRDGLRVAGGARSRRS